MDKQRCIIETEKLSYSYGNHVVFENLNIQVPYQSIYGFLGPNGAGKTTTIRLLLNLLKVNKPKITVFGKDIDTNRMEILSKTGSMIEAPSLYKYLTGYQNLDIMRRYLGISKSEINKVLEIVKLTNDAKRKVKEYSMGMCQRLGIAMALLNDPELLILDEPTNGLDPMGIKEIRELLLDLNQNHGKTIFVSSHILSEVQKLATHVAILHDKQLKFQGNIHELKQRTNTILELETENSLHSMELLKRQNYIVSAINEKQLEVRISNKKEAYAINKYLVENGDTVYQLKNNNNDLEKLFFNLIN